MKRLLVLIIGLLLTVFSVSAVESVDDQGNPNDPNVNERANACYDGAAWAGKCADDSYLWIAGWYYIRLETGLLTADELPAWLAWLIPQEDEDSIVEPEVGGGTEPVVYAGCYARGDGTFVKFTGVFNVRYQVSFHSASDCSDGSLTGTMVHMMLKASVMPSIADCEAAHGFPGIYPEVLTFRYYAPAAPADMWLCRLIPA